MSLNLIQSTMPIEYSLCEEGETGFYNPALCTETNPHNETISTIQGFWYDSNIDRYMLLVVTSQASWPGWNINSYEIHPETGLTTERITDRGAAVSLFWTRSWTAGDFNKPYALRIVPVREVAELDPVTFLPKATAVFQESDLSPTPFMSHFVINRAEGKVFLSSTSTLEVHDYNAGGTTLTGSMAMPMLTTQDMDYEDNERAWVAALNIDDTTMVLKANYNDLQFESITRLQPGPEPDVGVGIAYDSKRKMLGVFRLQPDDTDGSALHVLEIYKPFSVATGITEPVPLSQVVKGQVTTFSAHVYGDGGEVGQLKPVAVTNTGDGTILQSPVTPKSNGQLTFQYLAGNNPGTDTIQLEVDI